MVRTYVVHEVRVPVEVRAGGHDHHGCAVALVRLAGECVDSVLLG